MTLRPATLLWFARHEMRLSWRDIHAMLTAGHPTRLAALVIFLLFAIAFMHLIALGIIYPWVENGWVATKENLLTISVFGLMFWSVMLSQALESVTRAYYSRDDLDLILSSPASSRRLFAVRAAGIALTTFLLSCAITSPLINCLAFLNSWHWLAAYAVLLAFSFISTALGILITLSLFKIVGPKRTRFIAQIVAAIVGACFIIGIQIAAILYYNSYSGFTLLRSDEFIAAAPDAGNLLWIPARAVSGELKPFLITVFIGFAASALTIFLGSSSFSKHAVSTAGLARPAMRQKVSSKKLFRMQSQKQALRKKEWRLLQRDPWLLSQILMQIFYLLPPALMMWINFSNRAGIYIVVIPVLVMAAGQLSGGLAWLAISGEDAPELVATAPVKARSVLIAKIEAVLFVVALIMLPLFLLMSLASLQMAAIATLCSVMAASSAITVQMWFRSVAKRSMFRRRQVASRASTLCEALLSISWAGTAAVWTASSAVYASFFAAFALIVLLISYLMAPRQR